MEFYHDVVHLYPSLCRRVGAYYPVCCWNKLYICGRMGRILAIDYGRKRTGLAVTDVLQLIPGGLATVPTYTLLSFLADYFARESVECIVVGAPRQMNNQESEIMSQIRPFVKKIKTLYPEKEIVMYDERFTSILAQRTIIEAGIKKMKRQNKALVDEVSAVIILQSYLDSRLHSTYLPLSEK